MSIDNGDRGDRIARGVPGCRGECDPERVRLHPRLTKQARGAQPTAGEAGSSVAEFAMVTTMLMLLFLAVVSVGLWLYSRSLLTSAVSEAARFAANADVASAERAATRAAEALQGTVAAGAAATIDCTPAAADAGIPTTMVGLTCTMTLPAVLPLLGDVLPPITVTAHALQEPR